MSRRTRAPNFKLCAEPDRALRRIPINDFCLLEFQSERIRIAVFEGDVELPNTDVLRKRFSCSFLRGVVLLEPKPRSLVFDCQPKSWFVPVKGFCLAVVNRVAVIDTLVQRYYMRIVHHQPLSTLCHVRSPTNWPPRLPFLGLCPRFSFQQRMLV